MLKLNSFIKTWGLNIMYWNYVKQKIQLIDICVVMIRRIWKLSVRAESVVELQLPSKWQCDTRNLADTKHVKTTVLRTLTTKLKTSLNAIEYQ